MDEILQIGVLLGFIAIFALMVYGIIRSQKKATESRRQRASQLGFSPVPNPDPLLLERITRLRQASRSERVSLKNVFIRRISDGELYLFDMESSSGGEESSISEDLVMIVSPTLNLPHFGIFPRLGSNLGIMGNYIEQIVSWGLKRTNMVVVPVDVPRTFAERYMLIAESPEQVRDLITSGALDEMAFGENLHIEAEGDAFAFGSLLVGRKPDQDQEGSLTTLIDQAQRVLSVLQGYHRSKMY